MRIAKRTLLAAFGLSIAATIFLPHGALAQDRPDSVRLGFFGGPRPWIIGKAQKIFEEEMGTEVEWVQFGSGANALTALASRQVDISRMGANATVASIARGLPIKMIAISGIIARSERLIARPGIAKVADLKGRTVAYPPGSTAHYTLMAALKVANIKASDLTLLSLQPSEMLAAWERGDIDAGYIWGPFSHKMEASGGIEILATEDLQNEGYYVWNDYVVRTEFAEKYPDVVVGFLKAYARTMDMYHMDTPGMVKVVAAELGLEEATVEDTMAGLTFPSYAEQLSSTYFGEGGPILDLMQDQAAFLVELGDLRARDVPESFAYGVDTSYMKMANE